MIVKDSLIKKGNNGILREQIKTTIVDMLSLKCYYKPGSKYLIESWLPRSRNQEKMKMAT